MLRGLSLPTSLLEAAPRLNSLPFLSLPLPSLPPSPSLSPSRAHTTAATLPTIPSAAQSDYLPPLSRRPPAMASDAAADSDSEVHTRGRRQQSPLASQRPNGQAPGSRLENLFPLGFHAGFSQWWTNIPPAQAEDAVLSYVPYLQRPASHTQTGSAPPTPSPSSIAVNHGASSAAAAATAAVVGTTNSITDPYGPRTWHSRMVTLSGKNRVLNEYSIERTGEAVENNLVIIHGYGAGLGFFYKNFEPLSRPKGWQLYALDLLGMGRSSRPPFKIHGKTREEQIAAAEDWFVDSLEEWRIKRKIDKMTLMGHSMGGYMAVCYALKYPGRLNKLILASPVGIPEDPYATNAAMPDPTESTLQNEFTQDQETESTQSRADNNNFLNARSKAEAAAQQKANDQRIPVSDDPNAPPAPRKPLPKWLIYLWDANVSPFSFVRWSGPLGPRLVSGWTSRRFSHLPAAEARALHDYSYCLFRMRGSGEYALAYILAPGVFARSPLIRRIQGVGRQPLPSHIPDSSNGFAAASATSLPSESAQQGKLENGVPVVLMYGENDWMDVKGGYAAKKKIDATREKIVKDLSAQEKKDDHGSAKVVIIDKAGHHLYLDNPDDFNEVILKEMRDVSAQTSKAQKN